jgi:hypothetical protein
VNGGHTLRTGSRDVNWRQEPRSPIARTAACAPQPLWSVSWLLQSCADIRGETGDLGGGKGRGGASDESGSDEHVAGGVVCIGNDWRGRYGQMRRECRWM